MTTFVLVHSPLTGPVAWLSVAGVLEARGVATIVPELHDHGVPYWPQHAESVAHAIRRADPAGPVVLVAHSGAGALLPPIRRAIDSRDVAGFVFVDAGIPAGERSRLAMFAAEAPVAAAELAEHLEAGGRFPEWTDEDLAPLIPDGERRAALIRSLRPRGLDFWSEPIPTYAGWPDGPGGYVLLSASYASHAASARRRGWPVVEIEGAGHFHGMADPGAVAEAIVAVAGPTDTPIWSWGPKG